MRVILLSLGVCFIIPIYGEYGKKFNHLFLSVKKAFT